MSALETLKSKVVLASLENALVLFADYELAARKDGRNIIAERAAEELESIMVDRTVLCLAVKKLLDITEQHTSEHTQYRHKNFLDEARLLVKRVDK